MDARRSPTGTGSRCPALGPCLLPGMQILPTRLLLFALTSICVNMPAAVVKESNNTCKETKTLQGIPDATVLTGKIFYYPVPVFAFQGTTTQYKVTLATGADLPKWLDFNPNTSTLQGLPMTGESGAYLLNVAAPGGMCAQRAAANFTIHVQDSALFLDTAESWNSTPNRLRCGKEVPITSAEIILSAGAETLEAQERLYIVRTMAEYLHLDSSLVTLLQYTDAVHRSSQSLAVLAEDTAHIDLTVNCYVGLSWPVKCGEFAVLHKFIQILKRNVASRHLSQRLGHEIAGWRILRRGGYGRKTPRRQPRRLMITPTPTLKAIRTTQGPAAGAPSPVSSAVPSCLLLQLAVSPTQGLSLYEESLTIASYKMQTSIHLVSQESLVTLKMDSVLMPTNPTAALTPGDTSSPDLSPSLVTKRMFLFTELDVLPTTASGMALLLQPPKTHVPQTDSYFHPGKTEAYRSHLLQDVTSDTDLFSRPMYTSMINTLCEWPHNLTEAFPSKTEFRVLLPQATSTSEVPDNRDEAKSHFPKSEMLSNASLFPERLLFLSPSTSQTARASPDFTFPTSDMFPPSLASSSLSQELAPGLEQLPKTMPPPAGLPFTKGKSTVSSVIQSEALVLYSKFNFHPETSVCFSRFFYSTDESSPIILSYPNSTPVLTLPVEFSSFDMSELPTPTNGHSPYGGTMLKTQTQPASILSTKELHPGRDLGTGVILPNVTEPTLGLHKISDVMSDAIEAPLVTSCTATSHLFNNMPELVQTLRPSQQDASPLQFPTYETLQSTESIRILPPFAVSQELQKTPGQANTSPKVVHSIQSMTATIGCLFSFPVSANTFHDEEDGNSTLLSLQLIPADGSPGGSESWLQFNASQRTMHGYPLDIDFQYSPQEFVLSATDSGGLTACQSFTIELLKPTHVPCHLYTIRTKNSYFSFLRERQRVSLFLEKLSLYLNSSSPKDIAVATLKPGSTLISWYNSSLCTGANHPSSWCAEEEIQEALKKLRVTDGYASPRFVQAMLPEYRIDVIFDVSYSEVCFPTTKPFDGSFNSTVPTLQGWDGSTRKPPTALLSSLCVTVGLVLLTLACCFCRYHRKIPGSKFMTFHSNPQLSHADVAMDVLQPRKAPVHECGGSPSPPLWLPSLVPLASPEQDSRPVRLSHIIPPSQPPKYHLPPYYRDGVTTQHDQGNIHKFQIASSKLQQEQVYK